MGPHAAKFSVKLLMFLLTCYFGLDAYIGKSNTKGKIGFSNVRLRILTAATSALLCWCTCQLRHFLRLLGHLVGVDTIVHRYRL